MHVHVHVQVQVLMRAAGDMVSMQIVHCCYVRIISNKCMQPCQTNTCQGKEAQAGQEASKEAIEGEGADQQHVSHLQCAHIMVIA